MRKFVVVALSMMAMMSGMVVSAADRSKNAEPRLTYSLPRTVLSIEVEMERVTVKAGPYYRYAERYLNVKDAASEDAVIWKVKGIRLRTKGEADPEKTFNVRSAKQLTKNKKGVILGWNCAPQTSNANVVKEPKKFIAIESSDINPKAYSEDQLMANSVSQMAQSAAKEIYRIRDSRVSLATGDMLHMPADGRSMELMFEEMDKAESRLMSLFVGKKHKDTIVKTFEYVPSKKDVKNEMIFRLSTANGLVGKDDLSGQPVYISIKLERNDKPSVKKDAGELFYNEPGRAHVTIDVEESRVVDEDVSIAQNGSLQALPSSFVNAKLQYDATTGALISVEK